VGRQVFKSNVLTPYRLQAELRQAANAIADSLGASKVCLLPLHSYLISKFEFS